MLSETLSKDLTQALKSGDQLRVSTLRFVIASVKNKEIELRGRRPLSDDDVLAVLAKQAKNHEESIAAFEKGNRSDLAEKERAELAILNQYQPEQLSDEEIKNMVSQILGQSKETDFGKAMKLVMGDLKGRAGGAAVAKLVGQYLGS